ncbi:MAG: hypothetical protein Q8L26_00285 [Candidatus Omnitrophota bacterium]|nr:hypothetical protein [Candidatus Omnitrophota bacterium]
MALPKGTGFWSGKTACWEVRGCEIKPGGAPSCAAYKKQEYPCWIIKGTICKGESGIDVSVCKICKVYKDHGKGDEIKVSQ